MDSKKLKYFDIKPSNKVADQYPRIFSKRANSVGEIIEANKARYEPKIKRQRKGRIAFKIFIFISLVILGILTVTYQALATSIYDSTVRFTDDLTIKYGTYSDNLTDTWQDKIATTCTTQLATDINTAITSGYYSITYYNSPSLPVAYIDAKFTNTTPTNAYFEPTTRLRLAGSVIRLKLALNSNGTNDYSCSTVNSSFTMTDQAYSYLNYSNWPVTYPSGYEGLSAERLFPDDTDYSNAVRIADELWVSYSDTSVPKSASQELSGSWQSYIDQCSTDMQTDFANAMTSGSYWISRSDYVSGTVSSSNVYIAWDMTPDEFNWIESGSAQIPTLIDNDSVRSYMRIYVTSALAVAVDCQQGSTANLIVSNELNTESGYTNVFVWFANWPFTYPTNYTGLSIPSDREANIYTNPHFNYNVYGKQVVANYEDNIPFSDKNKIALTWSIYDSTSELVDTATLDFNQEYNAYVPEVGAYTLTLSFGLKDNEELPANLFVSDTVFELNISTNSYIGSTSNDDLVDGVYISDVVYEDCSTYGVNVVGGIGCVFGNFRTWLGLTMYDLFTPKTLGTSFASFQSSFMTQLGFLTFPLTFFYDMFASLIAVNTETCVVSTPNLNGFFGANGMDFNFCVIKNNSVAMWSAFQYLLTGAVAYLMITRLYHKYMELMSKGEHQDSAL